MLRTLLVEDSKLFVVRLSAALEEIPGLAIAGLAASLSEARAAIAAHPWANLIVLDLGLRGESGVDLLRELTPGTARATILVLTNDATPAVRKACLALGADGCFDKTLEFPEFLEKVGELSRNSPTIEPDDPTPTSAVPR